MSQAYLAEGSRGELLRLKMVLDEAGIAAALGAPPAGCAPST